MSTPPQPPEAPETPQPHGRHLTLNVPPDQEAGVYANLAAVWHDDDAFILDFSVTTTPPQQATEGPSGPNVQLVQAKVVSRVRIPSSQAWELMRALNAQLGQWEAEHGGSRHRPGAG